MVMLKVFNHTSHAASTLVMLLQLHSHCFCSHIAVPLFLFLVLIICAEGVCRVIIISEPM